VQASAAAPGWTFKEFPAIAKPERCLPLIDNFYNSSLHIQVTPGAINLFF
jgi:hypothetical protein